MMVYADPDSQVDQTIELDLGADSNTRCHTGTPG